ncbi:MAG: porin family protein [Vicinamibacterales bacterium]
MFKICSTLLAIAVALSASSRLASAQTFDGGVKGGLTFTDIPRLAADLEDAGADDVEWRIGRALGGFIAIGLTDSLAFQPELLWTQKGLKGREPLLDTDLKVEFDYVEIPVLVRLGPSNGQGIHVLAGPSFNFLTRARAIEEGTFGEDEDIKDETESVDVGLVVGLGYYGRLLLIEGRFEEGLRNVPKFPESDEKYRNRAFMILAGLRFGR